MLTIFVNFEVLSTANMGFSLIYTEILGQICIKLIHMDIILRSDCFVGWISNWARMAGFYVGNRKV